MRGQKLEEVFFEVSRDRFAVKRLKYVAPASLTHCDSLVAIRHEPSDVFCKGHGILRGRYETGRASRRTVYNPNRLTVGAK
jgi:hypothetical protein